MGRLNATSTTTISPGMASGANSAAMLGAVGLDGSASTRMETSAGN